MDNFQCMLQAWVAVGAHQLLGMESSERRSTHQLHGEASSTTGQLNL